MAVVGIKEFADFFEGYEDCYTIIGGAACRDNILKEDITIIVEC